MSDSMIIELKCPKLHRRPIFKVMNSATVYTSVSADYVCEFARAVPIPQKQVWRKMNLRLVKITLNWLEKPPKFVKCPKVCEIPPKMI